MIDWVEIGSEYFTARKWKHIRCIVWKIGKRWEGKIEAFGKPDAFGRMRPTALLFTSNFPDKDEAKAAVELYLKGMIEE